jgi:hypothetical protein
MDGDGNSSGVRIVAQPKASWLRFILFSGVDGISSRSKDWNSKRSEVALTNAAGKQRILKVVNTREEAQAEALRLEKELAELGPAEWCSRHEVPTSFFGP